MLSKYDDLLIHQTSYPLDMVATTDPRAFDRFIFFLHDTSGEFLVSIGAGVYPNLDVMDAGVSAVHEGKQWNVRMSRELKGADRADTTIGPIKFEVVEGLKKWRMSLVENEHQIAFDLEFTARSQPHECHQLTEKSGHYTHFDMHHYTQSGRYRGWLQIGGRRWEVKPDSFYGHRDRSWGVRLYIGGIAPAGRDPGGPGNGLRMWFPVQFRERCVFIWYRENNEGEQTHLSGAILYEDGRVSAPWVKVDHDIKFDPVTRLHTSSVIEAITAEGEMVAMELCQLLPGIYMKGMGYFRHGKYRGELHVEGEQWDLNVPGEELVKCGLSSFQLVEVHSKGEVGYGVNDHTLGPKHHRYGTAVYTAGLG